jgi:hypothetical protein
VNAHEGSPAGTRREALRERDSERDQAVISRLSTLAPALDGEPDPAFRAAARVRLVAMAAVRTPGGPVVEGRATVRGGWRRRLTAGLATVAVVAAALTALVAFAAGSGPGDPLYGVKRGTEQAELALAADSRRGPLLLHQAGTRLAEVRALAGESSLDPALVVQTLRTMDSQTADAAAWFDARAIDSRSAAPVDQLSRWTAGQSSSLKTLGPSLPAPVATAVEHSLNLLAATQSRADAVRVTVTTAARPPATVPTGGSNGTATPRSSRAPTSVVGGPGPGVVTNAPVPNRGTAPAPNPGLVPTLPSPGASSGIGGLPTLPVPSAGVPGATLPLPAIPVPSGTAVCVGPLSVGNC